MDQSIVAILHLWHDQGEWVGCREYWFWVTGLKRWQILMFYIVFELQRIFRSLQPDVWFEWSCDQNMYSILNEQVIYIEKSKLNIDEMWLIPLDRVTFNQIYFVFCKSISKKWGPSTIEWLVFGQIIQWMFPVEVCTTCQTLQFCFHVCLIWVNL